MTKPRRRLPISLELRWGRVGWVVLATGVFGAIVWSALDLGGVDPARVLSASPFRLAGDSAPESAPSPAAATASASTGDLGLVEICGLGWVEKKDPSEPVDPALLASIPGIDAAADALVERLHRSADAFEQAAAIVLEMFVGADPAAEAALLEQLARKAATSTDARVYATAFRFCAKASMAGSCALLSAGQWARLDDGNGEPWLFLLDQAVVRGDSAGVEEALHRIARAARFDDRYHALVGAIAAQAGSSDADLMAAQILFVEASAIAAAGTMPMPRLTAACQGAVLADANRKQTCDAIAATLAERSDTIYLAVTGAAIGGRVGWPEERVLAHRALELALVDSWSAVSNGAGLADAVYSCQGMREMLGRLGQLSRRGEPQFARDWIAASGQALPSFVERARAVEARRAAASDAASASRPGG